MQKRVNKMKNDLMPRNKDKLDRPAKMTITKNPENVLRKSKKRNDNCPHKMRKHYARSMCSTCYNRDFKSKSVFQCGHNHMTYYAMGMCYNCYDRQRKQKRAYTGIPN